MNKISGVYKITNTVTGEFYIGSSKDVETRWVKHKSPSTWKKSPNNQMYLDLQKYGIDSFEFQILEEVEQECLKETEQQFIEKLNPTYNNNNAKGLDVKRYKERHKEYSKEYYQQNREDIKEYKREYLNQLCFYKGEELTLNALAKRFRRAGIPHPSLEAKKYLEKQ